MAEYESDDEKKTLYTRYVRKEVYTPEQIKQWVNDQRESGKKRTFDGDEYQYDNLELIEQDYKKKKANGGLSSDAWMYSGKYLCAEVLSASDDPDEWQPSPGMFSPPAIFPTQLNNIDYRRSGLNGSVQYGRANQGRLLPWHEVKACNGIVMKHDEMFLTENADKCSYVGPQWYRDTSDYAIPTRGNWHVMV